MARALALNGAAHVFVLGRRQASLDTVTASVDTENIHPVVCDVTSKDSLAAAVSKIRDEFGVGAVDVLIANSGISGPSVPTVDKDGKPLPAEELVANMWKVGVGEVNESECIPCPFGLLIS
jgi:NAD(P)-dependent dehydrogenase (short-subunit alcohol dehydrogenase family)